MSKITPVSIALFLRNPSPSGVEMWMQQRLEPGPLFNLWEFPGGKIESSETPAIAVQREIKEEVGPLFSTECYRFFKTHQYQYKKNEELRNILLYVFFTFSPLETTLGKWFFLNFDQGSVPLKGLIPEINHEIIDQLLSYLKAQVETQTVNELMT